MIKEYKFSYRHYGSLGELEAQDGQLVAAAREACVTAYAPYSNFRVGTAARLNSGRVLTASNQESEVLPAGICAERNLLYYHQANFAEDPITAIAMVSDSGSGECYPCGMCRQVLTDSQRRQGSPIRVIMAGGGSATVVDSACDLMPFMFRHE